MEYDLHIHSKYSYDSFLKPETIIKIAKKKGLDGIAITDHNTIKGGIEASKINKNLDFQIIVGSEIKTEYGDIIGLYLNEEINSNTFEEVIENIRCQGGLSVLAHPYRQMMYPEKIVKKVDIVEILNARSKKVWNENALILAEKNNKPISAGSDSHTFFEIGKARLFADDNKNFINKFHGSVIGKESNYYLFHGISVLIEQIKKLGI